MRRGDAHLGVRYFADVDPRLGWIPLGSEEVRVVVPAAHRVRAKRVSDLRAFDGDTWLGFPADRRQPEASLERRLLAAGAANPRITPVDSLTAQKRLVEAGLGIALLPRSSFREELRLGRLRTIAVEHMNADQPVFAVRRRGGHHGPLESALLEILLRGFPGFLRGSTRARRRAETR